MLLVMMLLGGAGMLSAKTFNMPAWYDLELKLSGAPEVGRPLTITASLTPLLGEIRNLTAKFVLPPGWVTRMQNLPTGPGAVGQALQFVCEVVPPAPLPLGNIGFSFSADVPKTALLAAVARDPELDANTLADVKQRIEALPARGEGYADAEFILTEVEGFYPLGPDVWTTYDNRLAGKFGRGVVYFADAERSVDQAREVVELYGRLQQLIAHNASFPRIMQNAGVDLNAKRLEVLESLYALAVASYQKGETAAAAEFLRKFMNETDDMPQGAALPQVVAARNLNGLTAWLAGDKKKAEQELRDAFYTDRRQPLQRYVLRNLALLYLERGERDLARQTFGLARQLKPDWGMLASEAASVR